ncbi:hypothetical protein OAY83_00655 [Candidatus Marinimicrobia bacterium]|nr:hypothetical protein [Candidatus Neomarinimicrobiota bacterium]
MGTLGSLRNNSKPIIWFVIIAFVVGLAGAGLFSYISAQKLNLFGMSSPNIYSMTINGVPINHSDRTIGGNQNALDYIGTFYGPKSSFGMPIGSSKISNNLDIASTESEYHDIDIYNRHIQTQNELTSRVVSDQLYSNAFQNNISDIDILMFLKSEIDQSNFRTNVGVRSPIVKINQYLNSTYFIGFEEPFEDKPDGLWNTNERFVDLNNNRTWDIGEEFTDSSGNGVWDSEEYFEDKGNGLWDDADEFEDSGNGLWDEGEDLVDKNENNTWDPGEEFTDLPDGIWSQGEKLTIDRNNNGIWDDAETFSDLNNNNKWDEGENFEDTGDGIWDNGLEGWLDYCIKQNEIDYNLIYNKNIANIVKNYIKTVASYHIKNKKFDLAFEQFNYESQADKKDSYLLNNSNAVVSYISYDLNKLPKSEIESKINENISIEDIPEYENLRIGYFSTSFLLAALVLFIIFSFKNRFKKSLMSLGIFFSFLLLIIVSFKIKSDSEQGMEEYSEISYIYLSFDDIKGEQLTDLGNGLWDPGEEFTDNNQNGVWDEEPLEIDNNGNGLFDEGDSYLDLNENGKYDREEFIDLGNGLWNPGEKFIDDNANGVWDSKETLAKIMLDNLINDIETSGFDSVFASSEHKKEQNIILSKNFNQNNISNLGVDLEQKYEFIDNSIQLVTDEEAKIFASSLFDMLNSSLDKDENELFTIQQTSSFDGSITGCIIGYVSSKGNLYKYTELEKLKSNHIKEAQKTTLLEKNILEKDLFELDMTNITNDNSLVEEIKQNYQELDVVFEHDVLPPEDPTVKGYASVMDIGETSELIIGDEKAYIIYMSQKSTNDGAFGLDDFSYTQPNYEKFSNFFTDNVKDAEILDWKDESYYRPMSNDPTQNNVINDIYFNLNNFRSTIQSLYTGDFDIK